MCESKMGFLPRHDPEVAKLWVATQKWVQMGRQSKQYVIVLTEEISIKY